MAITSYSTVRLGNVVKVDVVSDLSGTIYYHWYLDGVPIASTESPTHTFYVDPGDQGRVEVQDTNDAAYDPVANAPAGYPARRTLWWVRSIATDVARYDVYQKRDTDAWAVIGAVHVEDDRWQYSILSARLDDLTAYRWKVAPVDRAGVEGTALELDEEADVVRTPDAPNFAYSYDGGTTKVTFSAA